MFYNKQYNKYVLEGSRFQLGENVYAANWCNLSTPEEKIAMGLEEVISENNPEDDRFYWVSDKVEGVVRTYTNTPKDLAQLKTQWAIQVNQTAYTMLLPSDWMVVKAIEMQSRVPAAWTTYRAAVRAAAATRILAIEATTTIPELQEAIKFDWPQDPNYKEVAVETVEMA